MTGGTSRPRPGSRWPEAAREAALLTITAVALALFYNGFTGKGIFGDPKPTLREAPPGRAPEIIPLELAVRLHSEGAALFVDARHEFDFRLGHIPGAMCIPLKESDAIIADLDIAKSRPVVVYCDGAECNSSLEVGSKFSAAGFEHVYVFYAGWSAWKESGHPTLAEPR